ncbi:hypothetical protein TELCIR_21580, partial [Teladorsagia circumcincta]
VRSPIVHMEKNGRTSYAPSHHVTTPEKPVVANGHEAANVANGHSSLTLHDGDASSGYGTLRNDASLPQP